jgi:hypothetical protein
MRLMELDQRRDGWLEDGDRAHFHQFHRDLNSAV